MSLDSIIVNAGRLRILIELAREPRQEFVALRRRSGMTDGNLATHAKRLQHAGMVAIDKSFRDGKPVTTFTLTEEGRTALHKHVDDLVAAIRPVETVDVMKIAA